MFDPAAKPITYHLVIVVAAAMILLSSCITNYPQQKPFVYQTNISVEGKYSTDEEKSLESQLDQQLHDSLRVNWQRKFLVARVLDKPPLFDTMNVGKSKIYMTALLNSLGYYRGDIIADTVLKIKHKRASKGDQYRTTVNFKVNPGTLIKLDSITYNLADSAPRLPQIDTLQAITLNSLNKKLIKKGDPFSKPLISAELDRLSDEYRDNGYLRFTKEQLLGVWDTVGIDLLRPTFDPIEQARQLEALRLRRQNPIADLEIRLKPDPDLLKLTRYYIANVKVFPDYNADTSMYQPLTEILTPDKYEFISYQRLFKSRKLIEYIYLHRGELYRQSNYLKTQNKFNSIGSWRLVNITQLPRAGEDSVDFEIMLVPAAKYYTSVNFDVSKNQGNLIAAGNLLGLGANLTLINRNFARSANQSTTTFRYGIELAQRIDSIQTQQFNLSHTIQIPRVVMPNALLRQLPTEWREEGRSFLGMNLGYIDRRDYYRVRTVNASWGYEFNVKKKFYTVRWPNIEFNLVERRPGLEDLTKVNASYKYIFNDGMIISILGNMTSAKTRRNITTIYKGSLELSGIPGFAKLISADTRVYRFIKGEGQIVSVYKMRKNAIALRAFLGLGKAMPFALNNGKIDSTNYWLPFFRQYFAGGPNSMRAWSVRKLGPGSTIKSFAKEIAPDRFGDIRIETNAEYRYYITTVVGFPLEGALFIDAGNVWFWRENKDFPNGEFKFNRFFTDIAVGVGTGFRIDFGLLKLRFDLGWKAKDPSPEDPAAQNKWFYNQRIWIGDKNGKSGAQFQIGIDYPF